MQGAYKSKVLWCVKGIGITRYLKVGYNVIVRYKRDNQGESDDNLDCFMWIASAKTMKAAKQLCSKLDFETEIRKFKIQKPANDSKNP